ncbi:MAG: 5-oxoprolinase subunit PxpB [Desulfohalobiaceae bacterium]
MTALNTRPSFNYCADWGLMVQFGDNIDPEQNAWTRLVARRLEQAHLPGILDVVPAYASFLAIYDPLQLGTDRLQQAVLSCCADKGPEGSLQTEGKTVQIPVCYQGEHAPDIEGVARHNNLSVQEVIDIHCQPEYLIYMLGFAPGFPYLGGLDPKLHTPRLDTPRQLLPAGSVGIAGSQTGIYPLPSPGGWRIIGRTPLRLFAPEQNPPVPYYAPGDRLKLYPVGQEEFQRLQQEEGHAG